MEWIFDDQKIWKIKKFFLYFARGAVGIAKITPIQNPINCRISYRITIKSIVNNLFAINHIIHNKLNTFLLHWWGLLLFYALVMQKKQPYPYGCSLPAE